MINQPSTIRDEQESNPSESRISELQERIISQTVNPDGSIRVVSIFSDDVWWLWPHFEQSNRSNAEMAINWLKVPECFREQTKHIIFHYWRDGRPRTPKPIAGTLRDAVVRLVPFLKFLVQLRVESLKDIRPIHLHSYIEDLHRRKIGYDGRRNALNSIDLLKTFSHCHEDRITFTLWPNSSPRKRAGSKPIRSKGAAPCSATPVIPDRELSALIEYANGIITSAEEILASRRTELRELGHYSKLRRPGRDILAIRNACFFLIGILTGMRCEEIIGIEVGSTRSEKILGVEVHWIRSRENKTKKGDVEYLSGPLGLQVVQLMERWSHPYRLEIDERIAQLQQGGVLSGKAVKEIETLKRYRSKVFLSSTGRSTVSGRVWGSYLKAMAHDAGVDWDLAPHQLRRTYARLFVRHRFGNILVLKEQFQHSTLGMTQLYGANPVQDFGLLEELATEVKACNLEVIDGWLTEAAPLAGGAGRKIVNIRSHTFNDRESMIQDTAGKISIRSTGHSWCLSQEPRGCGGRGIYEVDLCCDCKESVIDTSFLDVWQGILSHQEELRICVSDMSAGIKERIERDISKTRKLISELEDRLP